MEVFLNEVWRRFLSLFSSYMLMSAVVAWLSAQVIKIFTALYQHRQVKMNLGKLLFSTGGMPSSHSSSVVALTVAAGLSKGFDSPYFAIAGVLSIIVMIDASGVRYETGKQSAFLNKIANEIFSDDPDSIDITFKELVGHTPFQVFVGAILGIAVAIVLKFVMGVPLAPLG